MSHPICSGLGRCPARFTDVLPETHNYYIHSKCHKSMEKIGITNKILTVYKLSECTISQIINSDILSENMRNQYMR